MKTNKLGKNKKSSSSSTITMGQTRGTNKGPRKRSKSARKTSMIEVSYGPVNKNGVRKFVFVNPKEFGPHSLILDSEHKNEILSKLKRVQEQITLLGRKGKGKRSRGISIFDNVNVIDDSKTVAVEPTVV